MDIIDRILANVTKRYETLQRTYRTELATFIPTERRIGHSYLPEDVDAFTDPNHERPVLMAGVATHQNGKALDADIFERIDFEDMVRHILRNCPERFKKPSGRPDLANPGQISAGRLEFYVTGPRSELIFGEYGWLMSQRNPKDMGRPYSRVWKHLLSSAMLKARLFLQSDLGYSWKEVMDSEFSSFSILVHQVGPNDYRMQPPHVDVVHDQAQFLVALTNACKPVYVYDGPIDLSEENIIKKLGWSAKEREMADTVMKGWGLQRRVLPYLSPLFFRREKLLKHMKPALDRRFKPGEFAAGSGPLIHAGPETSANEFRAVMFFSTHLPHTHAYDPEFQLLPFIAALYANSSQMLYQTVEEWGDYTPERHFPLLSRCFRPIIAGKDKRRGTSRLELREWTESDELCQECCGRKSIHENECRSR